MSRGGGKNGKFGIILHYCNALMSCPETLQFNYQQSCMYSEHSLQDWVTALVGKCYLVSQPVNQTSHTTLLAWSTGQYCVCLRGGISNLCTDLDVTPWWIPFNQTLCSAATSIIVFLPNRGESALCGGYLCHRAEATHPFRLVLIHRQLSQLIQ